MSERFFIKIKNIKYLANEFNMLDTINYLNELILKSDFNVQVINYYIAECCFVLSNFEFYSSGTNEDYIRIKKEFLEFIKNNSSYFDTKTKFILGYFMGVMPNIFTFNIDNELEIENNGKKILEEIYYSNKDNLIYKFFYYGTKNKKNATKKIAKLLCKDVDDIFPMDSNIEEYFNSIIKNVSK